MGTSAAADTTMSGSRAAKSQAAFRTISEVADELDVAQHVLRFWESKFPQVRPLKRGGGRRYYRPEDIELLREIRTLLYDEGYTIKGAQKLLRQRRAKTASLGKPGEKPVQQQLAGTASDPPTRPEKPTPDSDAGPALTPSERPAAEPAPASENAAVPPAGGMAPPAGGTAPSRPLDLERLQAVRRHLVEVRRDIEDVLAEDD